MVRANILKTFNNNIQSEKKIDICFKKIGGTAYTNCYTPASDTPRGMASFYTGKYPKNHGCVFKYQWPQDFLEKDTLNLFTLFQKSGYKISAYCDEEKSNFGVFPKHPKFNINYNLKQYLIDLKKLNEKEENVMSFIILSDYHWAIDDYGSNPLADKKGQVQISNAFEQIFKEINPDNFDHIVIFSDHGFISRTKRFENKKYLIVNDDRAKIMMFVRQKGDKKLKTNNKLTTIMDIMPTFMDILKYKNKEKVSVDGVSLFENPKNRFVVMEDYDPFCIFSWKGLESEHSVWGVRTDKYFYFEDFEESALFDVLDENTYKIEKRPNKLLITRFKKYIEINSASYIKNKIRFKRSKIIVNDTGITIKYADGTPRVKERKLKSNISKYLRYKILKNNF